MEPDEREKEIQDILSDLDGILKSLTGRPSPEPTSPPAPETHKKEEKPEGEKTVSEPVQSIELSATGVPAHEEEEPAKEEPRAKLPSGPPLEISIPAEPRKPPAAPAPAPAPMPAPIHIPADASAQVRKVAFLVSAQQKAALAQFCAFLSEVALKVSKKPLYIQQVLVQEVPPEMDAAMALQKVKASGAAGTLALLAGLNESQIYDIEKAFAEMECFLRVVNPEDFMKRSAAIDLVVDLMLLKPS